MKIEINKYDIKAGLAYPVTLVFVSDLHDSENAPIFEKIDAVAPDGVLVGGDFIHRGASCDRGLAFMDGISKRYPTFAALGNHEKWVPDIRERLGETKVVLLDNSDTEFHGIRIGGLTSGVWYGGMPNLEWLSKFSKKDGFKLLLCHHPEYYEKYIQSTSVDLTLSGHAHGGQWRLFGRGLYAPQQGLFPKYTSGLYENRLLVGRGIGNKVVVPRFNNRPEIIVLKVY